jgi:hypothetical protein
VSVRTPRTAPAVVRSTSVTVRPVRSRHRPPGEPYEVGGGQGRHHLAVLRIEDAAREPVRQVGLQVMEFTGGDRTRPRLRQSAARRRSAPAPRARPARTPRRPRPSPRTRRPRPLRFGGEFGPQPPGEQGEFELGPGSLSETSRFPSPAPVVPPATGPRSTRRRQPRPNRVQSTGRPDHPGPDDHNIAGQSTWSRQYYVTYLWTGQGCADSHSMVCGNLRPVRGAGP